MKTKTDLKPITIEGHDFITITMFANAAGCSYATIYSLVKYGDKGTGKKLRSITWNSTVFIYLSELKGFTPRKKGRPRKVVK